VDGVTDWIIQCNPTVWKVFDWWETEDDELDNWTISRRIEEVSRGDRFAFWIGGREAGVYAMGKVSDDPEGPYRSRGGGYWVSPPKGDVWDLGLRVERYFFDAPIRKAELAADPQFRSALVLRMPRTANPIPLTGKQWSALERHARTSVRPSRGERPKGSDVAVAERPLGAVPEDIEIATPAAARVRQFREASLVKRYADFIKRPLVTKSARLPTGERLVADAYDKTSDQLIEAKASATRDEIRMAIGQLLDYRRHLASNAKLAVLVPERPSDDLVALVKSIGARVIYETRRGRFTSTR
jgi:hypothetical protein